MNEHDEENPMWAGLDVLAPDAAPGQPVCRLALPASAMTALVGTGAPSADVARFPTWDAPHTLLADDDALAEAVRGLGVPVVRPVSPYAVRQWDEREALEAAHHRLRDHDERPWGISAFEPQTAVVIAVGVERVRDLLDGVRGVVTGGLVVDARDPRDLRVFALAVLERGRTILVAADGVEDLHGEPADRALIAVAPER